MVLKRAARIFDNTTSPIDSKATYLPNLPPPLHLLRLGGQQGKSEGGGGENIIQRIISIDLCASRRVSVRKRARKISRVALSRRDFIKRDQEIATKRITVRYQRNFM